MSYLALFLAFAFVFEERQATPPSSIRVAEDFEIELLRSAQDGESSWISMTFGPDGDLFLGLDDRGVARLKMNDVAKGIPFARVAGTENLRHIRGILYAHDSLYLTATDSQEIYRLIDKDGDGQFEEKLLLQTLAYNSRYGHGMNQIVLGPDKNLYFVIGNDVVFPKTITGESTYRGAQNDWLLPYYNDVGQDDRVGYIAKVDPEGKTWTILAGGFRNPFDMAFNQDGEMFTWDADMEWDVGLPWYRPTRLNHVVLGGEYGWRWGTGKWPAWYPDSIPSTLDTGYSSPTALTFCNHSNWPEPFKDLLLMADWQLGRIFLVQLTPQGATYHAESELFAEGGPFNVCDMAFGPDGNLYCITGGRGSQSGLYRIRYSPKGQTSETAGTFKLTLPTSERPKSDTSGLTLRRKLETLQQKPDPTQVELLWEQLGSSDLWLASSARAALERLPVALWKTKLMSTGNNSATYQGLIALARVGSDNDQSELHNILNALDWSSLSIQDKRTVLRALQLSIIRHPSVAESARQAVLKLRSQFPTADFGENWLLQELLVRYQADNMVQDSFRAIESATTQEEQFQYAKTLLNVKIEWQDQDVAQLLAWLQKSRSYQGGKLLDTIRQQLMEQFLNRLTERQRTSFAAQIATLSQPLEKTDSTVTTPRPFVQKWTMETLGEALAQPADKADAERGRLALQAASCLKCHRFGELGTQIGPDLSGVGKRYDQRALLESIVHPSKQVDPKYLNTTYLMDDGSVVSGRTVGVTSAQLVIEVDSLSGRTETIQRAEIEASSPSQISPMPEGLIDVLTSAEIQDLIALLRRGPAAATSNNPSR
jgi:putative heme-binding domain-containing protein